MAAPAGRLAQLQRQVRASGGSLPAHASADLGPGIAPERFYEAFGFVHLPSMLRPSAVAQLQAEADRLLGSSELFYSSPVERSTVFFNELLSLENNPALMALTRTLFGRRLHLDRIGAESRWQRHSGTEYWRALRARTRLARRPARSVRGRDSARKVDVLLDAYVRERGRSPLHTREPHGCLPRAPPTAAGPPLAPDHRPRVGGQNIRGRRARYSCTRACRHTGRCSCPGRLVISCCFQSPARAHLRVSEVLAAASHCLRARLTLAQLPRC